MVLGETHPDRLAWIRTHLEHLLAGDTPAVITGLERAAQAPVHCYAAQSSAGRRRILPPQRALHAL